MNRAVPDTWIRNPSDRLAIRQGCYFDEDAGRFVCEFIERFCRQSKGKWGGQPLVLLDWQRDFLMRLFGWRRADGRRRFRRFYLEVAKKNGKSTLVSALVLYFLLADGEKAPEVYINACDREQASIVFDEAARMVRASPELESRLSVIDSRKRITDPANNGKIVANSADVPSKDGVNASHWIFDELHRQPSRQMWDIFEYAGESREQPLCGTITTAGEDTDGVWHEQREYSEQVNAGLIDDATHLGVVYRCDPADDLDDPDTWRKANPSLDATISLEGFERAYLEAKEVPSKWANFARLRLGIVSGGTGKLLTPEQWRSCNAPPNVEPGRLCYLGLDMSSRIDLSALVALFPDDEGYFDLLAWFWLPGDGLAQKEKRDGASYRAWADAGFLTLCDGGEIDYGQVKDTILEVADSYDLRCLGADPMYAKQLLQELHDGHGLPVTEVRQGIYSLAHPTREVECLVVNGKLRHGGHPVMAWCASNAVARKDSSGNIRLDKEKSRKRIDGMAALVNARAVAGENHETQTVSYTGLVAL